MRFVNARRAVREVEARWLSSYRAHLGTGDIKDQIYQKLHAMDRDTAAPEDVDVIIGNNSWTRSTCDECGTRVVEYVEVNEPPDYDSATVHLCLNCVRTALAMFDADNRTEVEK